MIEALWDHPDDEALRAMSLGRLDDARLGRVSAHLDACPGCCLRIDRLAATDDLVARLQEVAAVRGPTLVDASRRRPAVDAWRNHTVGGSGAATFGRACTPPAPPSTGRVGGYEILAEVGRGGMGVVYQARHLGLRRLAALKMVLAGEFASPSQELRFRLEAELAARLQHPNIVQVYEIGNCDGRPFLAMEWVEGGSLADRLDGTPWPPGEAASLVQILAQALEAAHREGVVHRDVKPANILLAREARRDVSDGGGQAGGGGGGAIAPVFGPQDRRLRHLPDP